jgi:glyoxylase-like metal-dependent hydrolase (beta-lactamase superfamily II)
MEEVAPDIALVAVRTPTLPPATHTNSWVLGRGSLTVVDPASPYDDERVRLHQALRTRTLAGERVERLLLTHHHHDHVAGAMDLRDRLRADGQPVRVAAHPITADLLAGIVEVDDLVPEGHQLDIAGRPFQAVFTPGHAPGHIALHDAATHTVVAGDMVAGIGTIVLDPTEADLQQYLDSLERLRALRPERLLPAHGPVLLHPDTVLSFYVAHRHQRSEQIRSTLALAGQATAAELAPRIYPELDPAMHPVGAAQITTHLQWLEIHGLVRRAGDDRWAT